MSSINPSSAAQCDRDMGRGLRQKFPNVKYRDYVTHTVLLIVHPVLPPLLISPQVLPMLLHNIAIAIIFLSNIIDSMQKLSRVMILLHLKKL